MSLRLATAIVSTRQRANTLRATLDRINDDAGIDTILDRAKTATANTLAAWQHLATQDATHALLLHDDLDASHGWRTAASLLVATHPQQRVIALHTTREAASQRGRSMGWEPVGAGAWREDQAVLMPIPVVKRYLEWVRQKHYRRYLSAEDFLHHGNLLAAFHHAYKTRHIMVATPPLFQHAGDPAHHAPTWRGRDFNAATHFRQLLTERGGQRQR